MKENIEELPVRRPEEMQILDNLDRITAIDNRTRALQDKIRCNPLNFMGVLVWEVELERLEKQKSRLQKRNRVLHVSDSKHPKRNRCIGMRFSPIPIIALAKYTHQQFQKKMNMEKTEDEQLEELNNLRLSHTERIPERIRWPETAEEWIKMSPAQKDALGEQHEREDFDEYKAAEPFFPEIRETIQRHEQDLERDEDNDLYRDDDRER